MLSHFIFKPTDFQLIKNIFLPETSESPINDLGKLTPHFPIVEVIEDEGKKEGKTTGKTRREVTKCWRLGQQKNF